MKKILERLIIFFVGLPLTVCSVYFLPHYHFLVLHLIVFGFTTVAIIEVHAILAKRMAVYPVSAALVTGLIIPLIAYGNALAYFSRVSWLFGIACALYGVFCIEIIYSFSKPFEKSIERMASGVFIIFYPGFFASFVSSMTRWEEASHIISVFFLMIFTCDSLAWLCGMLFGKNNRGYVPASPNKSIAGFVGGVFAPIAVGALAYLVFPSSFGKSFSGSLLTGLCTALAAIAGDLVESILKRSAQVKDSGAVILGRGGVMDTIDSIIMGAPMFYLCYRLCIGV